MNKRGADKGDQWVTFEVEIPRLLDDEQRELIQRAFKIGASEPSATKTTDSKPKREDHQVKDSNNSTDPTDGQKKRGGGFFDFLKDLKKKDCQSSEKDKTEVQEDKKKEASGSG